MNQFEGKLSGKNISKYTLREQISGGAFGQVYRAVDNVGEIVAIKIISLTSLLQYNGLVKQLLIEEVDSMAKIDNPNVVKLLEYIESQTNCYLIMEYCDSGNLKDFLSKNQGQLPQKEALSIFKQILNGIMYLHEQQIMHRNLNLDNIFLHQGQQVKIGDLGFSKRLQHKDAQDDLCLGTLGYMAPEVAKKRPYGLEADIFSMGVILFELLYGRLPFSNYNFAEFIRDVQRNQINFGGNPSVSQEVIHLIKAMLKENPQDRLTFYEINKLSLFIDLTGLIEIVNQVQVTMHQENYESQQKVQLIESNHLNIPQPDQEKQEINVSLVQQSIYQRVEANDSKLIKQEEKSEQQSQLWHTSYLFYYDKDLLKNESIDESIFIKKWILQFFRYIYFFIHRVFHNNKKLAIFPGFMMSKFICRKNLGLIRKVKLLNNDNFEIRQLLQQIEDDQLVIQDSYTYEKATAKANLKKFEEFLKVHWKDEILNDDSEYFYENLVQCLEQYIWQLQAELDQDENKQQKYKDNLKEEQEKLRQLEVPRLINDQQSNNPQQTEIEQLKKLIMVNKQNLQEYKLKKLLLFYIQKEIEIIAGKKVTFNFIEQIERLSQQYQNDINTII